MLNTIKHLFEDFNEFRRVRRIVRNCELSESHKSLILETNPDKEKELNAIILHSLVKEMLGEGVSVDYVKGFRSSLTIRIALMNYKSKFNNKQ